MQKEKHVRLLGWAFLFLFAVLLFRCFQLQVLFGSNYREWSERNSVRQIPVLASRGHIFDREGRILVDNRPSYSLFLVPHEFSKNLVNTAVVSSLLGLSEEELVARIDEVKDGLFTPVRVIKDMDFETLSKVEENRLDLPGIFYQVEPARTYPVGVRATHVLGYLGEISEAELKSSRGRDYRRGDIVGKSGVERNYDSYLRGEGGYRYVEVDVRGREVGNFRGRRDVFPVSGRDLMLTLDLDLQGLVEEILDGRRGSVVVMNPQNGEILAMSSKPDYSLEPFARGVSPIFWERLRQDSDKPLLHRTIQAQLPPGSTYKLILTAAALEEGLVSSEADVFCRGYFRLGKRVFHCWKSEGHGFVDLLDALEVSCNVYFYQLGLKTGVDRWARYGKQFGFGLSTQIDLMGEGRGLLPNRRYLDEKYGSKGWSKGMVVNLAVGQGDLLVTPIQMAKLAAIIAMEGRFFRPHVVKSIQDPVSGVWEEKSLDFSQVNGFSSRTYKLLKEGMYRVVNNPLGTGRGARVHSVDVCGKTGTAQNPQGEPHSWFIGFAPRVNPEVSIVVVIENGGSGGSVAAPLAGLILRWFFGEGVAS